jgi:hypothetical protein
MKKMIKLSGKEDAAPIQKVAASLLEALLFPKNKNDDVVVSFILTETNREQMSEKLISVLRFSQSLISKPGNRFYDENNKNGTPKILMMALPVVKTKESDVQTNGDVLNGFGERIKVHEVRVFLGDKKTKNQDDTEHVSVSLKAKTLPNGIVKQPKSAGSTASRVLRTLIGDGKDCAVDFVLTPYNSGAMCEKIVSMMRIMQRMQKDPASIIFNGLPSQRIDYVITASAPVMIRVPARNREKETLTTVNEIVFNVK